VHEDTSLKTRQIKVKKTQYKIINDQVKINQSTHFINELLYTNFVTLSTHAHPICLNIFLYIVVHYRPVIYLLNNLISFYIARISYYREVVYKFKYLKL